LGRLRADAEPVLRPVGDDVDDRRLLLGVVLADLLDDLAVPLLAGVDDNDAVVRRTDLAHALETDLDGHGCGVSSMLDGSRAGRSLWGKGDAGSAGTSRAGERVHTRRDSARHCARGSARGGKDGRASGKE